MKSNEGASSAKDGTKKEITIISFYLRLHI